MIIKNIFEKEIDREIRGVIKVDKGTGSNKSEISYRESIEKQELEEYVVTNELQKHFSTFFSNYKKRACWRNRTYWRMDFWFLWKR